MLKLSPCELFLLQDEARPFVEVDEQALLEAQEGSYISGTQIVNLKVYAKLIINYKSTARHSRRASEFR